MKTRIDRIKNTVAGKPLVQVALVLLAALLLTLLLGSGATLTSGGKPETALDLSSAVVTGGVVLAEDGSLEVTGPDASLYFYDVGVPAHTVAIDSYAPATGADGEKTLTPVTATALLLQTTGTGFYSSVQTDQAALNPAGRHHEAILKMRTNEPVGAFQIFLSCPRDTFRITAVTLNKSGFSFNILQFLLYSAIGVLAWSAWHFKWYRLVYNDADTRHKRLFAGVALLCTAAVVWLMFAANGPQPELLWEYDPENAEELLQNDDHYTHYYHLFDALQHDLIQMRAIADERLAQLENPYNPAQREGLYYLWDFAYYKGSYYVYFGPAPMPLYFLLYGLTGKLPSPALACAVPAILAIWLLWGALRELLRYLKIKANLLLLFLSFPALVSGALVFLFASLADTYVQPYLWATCGLAGFLWAFFRTLRTGRPLLRLLGFTLAGCFVVLIAASRPTGVLFCMLAAALPAWQMLQDKSREAFDKVLEWGMLLIPVVGGAIILMGYNYVRFESPFEFGNQLQLTVGDMRTQNFRLSPVWLLQALYAYLCKPLQIQPRFPYLYMEMSNQFYYGGYFFNYTVFGLLNLPLFWGLGAVPNTLRRARADKKALYIGWLAGGALLLWFVYCTGNLLYRYISDVSVALGLLAVLVLLELLSCKPAGKSKLGYLLTAFLFVGTTVVGLLLCFENERNFIYLFNTDSYLTVAQMLRLG